MCLECWAGLRSSPTSLHAKVTFEVDDYEWKASMREASNNKGRAFSDPGFALRLWKGFKQYLYLNMSPPLSSYLTPCYFFRVNSFQYRFLLLS
jgi:hypothetical protein